MIYFLIKSKLEIVKYLDFLLKNNLNIWQNNCQLIKSVYKEKKKKNFTFFWDLYFYEIILDKNCKEFINIFEFFKSTKIYAQTNTVLSFLRNFINNYSLQGQSQSNISLKKYFDKYTKLTSVSFNIQKVKKLIDLLLIYSPTFFQKYNKVKNFLFDNFEFLLKINYKITLDIFTNLIQKKERNFLIKKIEKSNYLIESLFSQNWFELSTKKVLFLDFMVHLRKDETCIYKHLSNLKLKNEELESILLNVDFSFSLFCFYSNLGKLRQGLYYLHRFFDIDLHTQKEKKTLMLKKIEMVFTEIKNKPVYLSNKKNFQVILKSLFCRL